MVNTNDLTKMGRRRFTRTLGAIGLSAGAIANLTKGTLADLTNDPTDEVPRLRGHRITNLEEFETGEKEPDIEPVYYTIPRDKWVKIETAYDAAERVNQQIGSKFNSDLISAGVTTIINGQHRQKAVEVTYTRTLHPDTDEVRSEPDASLDEVVDGIPDEITGSIGSGEDEETVEGLPIVVKETEERPLAGCSTFIDDFFDYHYRDPGVPFGARLNNQTTGYVGSTGYDWTDGVDVVLTTAHGFIDEDAGEDSDDAIGRTGYQPREGYSRIGEVKDCKHHRTDDDVDRPLDIAVVELDSNIDRTYRLASDDGGNDYDDTIGAVMAWDGVKDLEDDNEPVHTQGKQTGRCDGKISSIYEHNDPNEIISDNLVDHGDSGGSLFYRDDDTTYAVGIIRAGGQDPPSEYVRSMFLNDVRNIFGVDMFWPAQ